ncbi:SymE family type I addiction module toxin [Stenotrophomonas sp. PS02297]|uniref:SymE family type I addiction module toxin n=1 Tax=Stenotrophomonas sp. PS02297 TaxID=2991423 RepID=UPI00249A3EDA|nr:SymE family type I addiction module toxin [Stenotrophomonas sp. PS02297]
MRRSKEITRASTPASNRSTSRHEAPTSRMIDSAPLPVLFSPPSSTPPASSGWARMPKRCTMGYLYYDERRGEQIIGRAVPKLRLSGRWLERCGFAVGDALQVTVGNGLLLISRGKGDD